MHLSDRLALRPVLGPGSCGGSIASATATANQNGAPAPCTDAAGVGSGASKIPSGEIWATSAAAALPPALQKRDLLADRKGPVDHLKTKPLVISAMRVAVLQASSILASFVTDQLESESAREELVVQGKLTANEADAQNSDWEAREWKVRWSTYRHKATVAFAKLQATTLVMRLYERIASGYVDDATLDRLTKDAFKSSVRKADRIEDKREVQRQMVTTCLWANAIAFMADATVQQVILTYGYYIYYQGKKRKRRAESLEAEVDNTDASGADDGDEGDADKSSKYCPVSSAPSTLPTNDELDKAAGENGGIALSFFLKSAQITVSRSLGFVAASYGGSIGSMIYPGWGTLFGTSVGDSMVAAVLD